MGVCRWCNGRGYQQYERGSSLIYTCPDCDGAGYLPECDICGEEYCGDFCEDCYAKCECCGDVFQIEELKDGLCAECFSDNE